MRVEEREAGDVTILDFRQNLVGGPQADSLRQIMQALVGDGRKHIVFNFRYIRFIASQGIGIMMGSNRICHDAGGRLVLCEPNPRIASVIKLYQLARVIDVYDTEAQAIASFGLSKEMASAGD